MSDISPWIVPVVMVLLGLLLFCFAKPRAGLGLCVLALPLYWVPESFQTLLSRLMTSSQIPIFADALVIATLLGAIFMRRPAQQRRAPVTLALCLFIVVSALSMLNSSDWSRSIGNFGSYVQLAMMTFIIETLADGSHELHKIVRLWMLSLAFVLAAGLFGIFSSYVGLDNFSVMTSGQVRSTFRFPNQLSLYLVITGAVASAFIVSPTASRWSRRLAILAMPILILVLVYSGSRSGVAAAMGATAVLLAFHGRRKALYIPAVVFIAAGALWATSLTSNGDAWQDIRDRYDFFSAFLESKSTGELQFYKETNQVAWSAFYDHPIVGSGIGAVVDTGLSEDQAYEIHNTYLGLLGQTGLLGLFAFAAVVLAVMRNIVRARRYATSAFVRALAEGCVAAIVAMAIHGYGNFDWRLRHLWLVLAFTSVLRLVGEQERAFIGQSAVARDRTGLVFAPAAMQVSPQG